MYIGVRVFAVLSLVITLISWSFGISAILHPAGCPGAFNGCPQNGEETSYYFGYLVGVLTVIAGILSVILTESQPEKAGKWFSRLLLVLSLIFFPIPLGLVLSIFWSTVLPGYGIFAFLLIPVCINLLFLTGRTGLAVHERPSEHSFPKG
jgi:uncharacterized membrane protein HdeD (DUF308 family)